MIIKYKDEEYIVIYLFCGEYKDNRRSDMFCWNLRKSTVSYIDFLDAEVIDGRLPPNMCLNRSKEKDDKGNLVGWSCFLESNKIFKNSSWFWEALEDNEPKANLLFHQIINEMKMFHGLPLDDISELEEAVQKQMKEEGKNRPESEEERKKRELDEELEEYLRIGEELSKEKNPGEK